MTTYPLTSARKLAKIKAALRRRGVTHFDVARAAGVTESMIWFVLSGRRRSARVFAVIDQILADKQ